MDYYELLEYLDLEEAGQFEYFEAMADLIESEEYIDQEAMYMLFDGADNTMIGSCCRITSRMCLMDFRKTQERYFLCCTR